MLTQVLDHATVVRYGAYGKPDNPLRYERGDHAGQPIEFVTLLFCRDDGSTYTRDMTLHAAINGDRPEAGAMVQVHARVGTKQDVVYRRDGSERIITRDKWRAEGFTVIKPKS